MRKKLRKIGLQPAKNMLVVFVERRRVMHVTCRLSGGQWKPGRVEVHDVPPNDTATDVLRRRNQASENMNGTRLVVIVSPAHYGFHKESYPLTLGGKLDKILEFDAVENVISVEGNEYFHGEPVRFDSHVHVPVFTISEETRRSLLNSLYAPGFNGCCIVPSGLLLAAAEASGERSVHYVHPGEGGYIDVHRFYKGAVMESFESGPEDETLSLWRQRLALDMELGGEADTLIRLVGGRDGCSDECRGIIPEELNVEEEAGDETLLMRLVAALNDRDVLRGFGGATRLKPRKVPKAVWAALLLVMLYALFSYNLFEEHEAMNQRTAVLDAQIDRLEAEWEPLREGLQLLAQSRELEEELSEYAREAFSLLSLMEGLTRITPEDTWVSQLHLRGNTLVLRGQSDAALKFQNRLLESDLFVSAEFESDIRRSRQSDKEEFVISAEFEPSLLQAESVAKSSIRSGNERKRGRDSL